MIVSGEPVAADLDVRAVALGPKPDVALSDGVQLAILERLAEGVGVCVVRMAPFAALTHRPIVTEDVYVLEGRLTDGQHETPAGAFLRWRSGAERQLATRTGCLLALAARPAGDRERRCERPGPWLPSYSPGLFQIDLVDDRAMRVVLLRFDPGTAIASHTHEGGEELFVIEGELEDEHGRYPKGSWVRQPPGSRHAVLSRPGCVLWTTSGHLAGPARQRLERCAR